jgi:hypothetical protein
VGLGAEFIPSRHPNVGLQKKLCISFKVISFIHTTFVTLYREHEYIQEVLLKMFRSFKKAESEQNFRTGHPGLISYFENN